MKQRKFIRIIIILLVICALLIGVGIWQRGREKTRETSEYEKSAPKTEQKSEPQIPQAPKSNPAVYRGFWMPASFWSDGQQSMADINLLKDVGANVVCIGPNVKINTKGQAKIDVPDGYVEVRMLELAKKYYSAGIDICLVLEVFYEDEFHERSGGEPKPFPKDKGSQTGFLDEYNLMVERMAKLAEKYHFEIFSPMNEPDLKMGEQAAAQWGQKVLPIVRKDYSGKILWKAAGGALDRYDTNFKGYDIIGLDPSPGGGPFERSMTSYKIALNNLLTIAQNRANRDNVPQVMITEFGVWGEAVKFNEEQKALAHRVVFEQGQGRVSGFIALDPPPDLDRGLAGTKTLEEIKAWFKKLGN